MFINFISGNTQTINLREVAMKKLLICMLIAITALLFLNQINSKADSDVSSRVSEKILRLHVIANSDSDEDQQLKLEVKSALVKYLEESTKELDSKEAYIEYINNNQEQLISIASSVICENGYDYDVELSVGSTYFPVKTYGDLTFPCGHYDALCVRIGHAEGKNWWCVLYPPLCFVDLTYGIVPDESKESLHTIIGDNDYYALLTKSENITVHPRFFIVDAFKEFFNKIHPASSKNI